MPKLEPKQIQQELKEGKLRPVYWLYGQERMKSRELLKRIRKSVLGEDAGGFGFAEDILDGTEVTGDHVVDSAQSLSLGGGLRFVVVKDAHALKEADSIAKLMESTELTSVCVFLSKDLDGRKKLSKLLVEKAAVVACEEVPEEDREAWIGYLAKARGLELRAEIVTQLRSMEPWSLDIVDLELQKLEVSAPEDQMGVILGGIAEGGTADELLDALLGRHSEKALPMMASFASKPDESLPFLGLLSWNVRQLALVLKNGGTRGLKLSPFIEDRFRAWAPKWKLEEMLELQSALAEIDFSLKQTPRLPLGLWDGLIFKFGQSSRGRK